MRWFMEADVSMRNSRMGIFSRTLVLLPTLLALLPSLPRTTTRTLHSQGARGQRGRGGDRTGQMGPLLAFSFCSPNSSPSKGT